MIPKIIHFCWLSNDPYPEKIRVYMDRWKEIMPDFEFVHWNFDRFPMEKSIWVEQAFKCRKYAFAADYIRLYALYNYGGFYLDTDVEVLKSFEPLVNLNSAICWQRDIAGLEVAAFGVSSHCPWIKQVLDRYENRLFIKEDGTFDIEVLPEVVERCLRESNFQLKTVDSMQEALLCQDELCIPIFTSEFFSPKSYVTKQIQKTQNTFCVHHFEGSWLSKKEKERLEFRQKVEKKVGKGFCLKLVMKIYNFFY